MSTTMSAPTLSGPTPPEAGLLPVGALARSMEDFVAKSVDQKIARLIDLRLRRGGQTESLPARVRRLVNGAIFEQPVLYNDMYRLLLSGSMDDTGWATFFSEYHYASCKGFTSVVGKAAAHFEEPNVRGYLKAIHDEEHTPRAHHRMLEDFITGCGYAISEPTIAHEFVENSLKGFTRSEPYSLGYSLGVEVEADFQIALLGTALLGKFDDVMAEDEWFNLHLGADGEEFHSRLCVNAIVASNFDDAAFDELDAGFVAACRDTQMFMNGLAARIKGSSLADLKPS